MKRLNDFIETAHLFWVFLFGWFFTGLFIASIFYFSGSFVVEPRMFRNGCYVRCTIWFNGYAYCEYD